VHLRWRCPERLRLPQHIRRRIRTTHCARIRGIQVSVLKPGSPSRVAVLHCSFAVQTVGVDDSTSLLGG
jgi:hypothetical protein